MLGLRCEGQAEALRSWRGCPFPNGLRWHPPPLASGWLPVGELGIAGCAGEWEAWVPGETGTGQGSLRLW